MSMSLTDDEPLAVGEWDKWGAWLSAGCVVHCLAAPVLLTLVPVQLASLVWSPVVHLLVACLSVAVVLAAVVPAYLSHRHPLVPFLATVGCGFVLLGCLWPCAAECGLSLAWQNGVAGVSRETFIALWTPAGALSLVAAHVFNSRLRLRACC